MIIPIYQPLFQSTHKLAESIGKKYNEKATHTGTLDPMAEGVVVVLTGEDRFKKPLYNNTPKEYVFQILFGINTDTHDLLGLHNFPHDLDSQKKLQELPNLEYITEQISEIKSDFLGLQKQQQPKFSAQRIAGTSAFALAKTTKDFELSHNLIEILSLDIQKSHYISLRDLELKVEKVKRIEGDFRQKEILANWQETLPKLSYKGINRLPIVEIKVSCSKRTYIRSIVRDIATKLNLPATTASIIRTKNGGFGIGDCQILI